MWGLRPYQRDREREKERMVGEKAGEKRSDILGVSEWMYGRRGSKERDDGVRGQVLLLGNVLWVEE